MRSSAAKRTPDRRYRVYFTFGNQRSRRSNVATHSAWLDSDGDGLPDAWENAWGLNKYDPNDASIDSDGDGLANTEEFFIGSNPSNRDTDEDGLIDGGEVNYHHTDPNSADTDGDGFNDGNEVANHSDPLSSASVPKVFRVAHRNLYCTFPPDRPDSEVEIDERCTWSDANPIRRSPPPVSLGSLSFTLAFPDLPPAGAFVSEQPYATAITPVEYYDFDALLTQDRAWLVRDRPSSIPVECKFLAVTRRMHRERHTPVWEEEPPAFRIVTLNIPAGAMVSNSVDMKAHLLPIGDGYEVYETAEETLLPVEMMVDANRDGEMSFDNSSADQTTAQKSYKFWLNNDHDIGDSDQSSGSPDWQKDTIDQKRDLEDFTRLWISFKGITEMVKTGGVTLQLEWKPMDGSTNWPADGGNPWIKVFPAAEADGGKRYVEEETGAAQQLSAPYKTTLGMVGKNAPRTLTLPTPMLNALSESNPNIYLLFEGVSAGKGRLVLNLLKGTTKIGEYPPLYLDIRDIRNMYERWTVDPGTDVPIAGADPQTAARICPWRLPAGQSVGFAYDAQSPEEKKYIVFAHGWNMATAEKDNFAETSYKRLWWHGYKGRFAAFQWPTNWDFDNVIDIAKRPKGFDEGEFIAWRSAPTLAGLLNYLNGQCPGQVYLMAHSHGNVVAGEALRLLGRAGQSINTYAACQGAVAAESYDPSTLGSFHLEFPPTTGPSTPDIYPNWLTPNSTGVAKKVNFFNLNDWALNKLVWEADQELKPDFAVFGKTYHWGSPWNIFYLDPNDRFTSQGPFGVAQLDLGSQAHVGDRYEIMSFAAEAQSRALGRVSGSLSGFSRTLDLQVLWGVDPFHNSFRERAWHSGQFNFSNMQVRQYWGKLLETFGLPFQP